MSRRARRNAASKDAAPQPAASNDAAPRLLVDAAGAALLLFLIAFFARTTLTPDGVAYFENAELLAHGQWSEAIQGYWSPGYSLLLAPVVWLTGDDRALFVAIAHVVQAVLGVVALGLAMRAVQARVPAVAQRVVYWGCAWVILRWLSQELLTPDLLLCVLLLLFVVRLPARSTRDQLVLGALAGAGFLVKTSVWPWLVVAAGIAALRALRAGDWRTFPRAIVATSALIAGAFVLTLSVRAGHPTLGSVGPLNARWYLGDPAGRTPDTDKGPHPTKGLLILPTGASVPFHDLRRSTRTYLPWSDPERWAAAAPPEAVPVPNASQAMRNWLLNLQVAVKWMLPVAAGLALILRLLGSPAVSPSLSSWLLDRPILSVGIMNAIIFLLVHAEVRLLAPAALQCLLGAWATSAGGRCHAGMPWAARAAIAGIALQLGMYFAPLPSEMMANAASEAERHRYLDEQLARNPKYGAIIVGRGWARSGAITCAWRCRSGRRAKHRCGRSRKRNACNGCTTSLPRMCSASVRPWSGCATAACAPSGCSRPGDGAAPRARRKGQPHQPRAGAAGAAGATPRATVASGHART